MNPQSSGPGMPPKNTHKTLIASIVLGVLLIVALVFGYSSYQGKQDYKNKSDQKVAAAVKTAVATAQAQQKATDDQAAKAPYKTFKGPVTYGSVSFNYPKSWSAYVDESGTDEPINGYFYPDQVPGTGSNTPYALRVELVSSAYAEVVGNIQSAVSDGTVQASAYLPPKMKNVANVQTGLIATGAISTQNNSTQGTMVIIKVRDKTLKIYTESGNFASDFNNIVLPSLSFSP